MDEQSVIKVQLFSCSALVRWQEGHSACKEPVEEQNQKEPALFTWKMATETEVVVVSDSCCQHPAICMFCNGHPSVVSAGCPLNTTTTTTTVLRPYVRDYPGDLLLEG